MACAIAGLAFGQGFPPPPVVFARVVEGEVRGTIELSGTVASRRSSVVASEVSGVVVEVAAREGDRVKRGAPLVRLRRENAELRLAAASGELKEARARLRLAEAGRSRAQGLFEEEIISVEELDDALSEYEARLGRVEQLEAQVKRLEDDVARTIVRAPFSGAVVAERVAEGEWIGEGGAVAEMVDVQNLELDLELPEQYYGQIAAGEPVRVAVAGLDGLELDGEVRAVVPAASAQARTFPVKVALENPGGRLGVGMLARARFSAGAVQRRLLVPKDAVVGAGAASAVFVIAEDNSVERVPVQPGVAAGSWVAVSGGLGAGDRVVTVGNERLMPGQKVAPEEGQYSEPEV